MLEHYQNAAGIDRRLLSLRGVTATKQSLWAKARCMRAKVTRIATAAKNAASQ